MRHLLGTLSVAALTVAGAMAQAASIDISAFDTVERIGDQATNGVVNGVLNWVADAVWSFDSNGAAPAVTLSNPFGTDLSDPSQIELLHPATIVGTDSILDGPAEDVALMTNSVEYLFRAGDVGYLATITSTAQGVDFLNVSGEGIDVAASFTLDRLTVAAPVPLPASLPLVLVGIGGLAFVARRRQS